MRVGRDHPCGVGRRICAQVGRRRGLSWRSTTLLCKSGRQARCGVLGGGDRAKLSRRRWWRVFHATGTPDLPTEVAGRRVPAVATPTAVATLTATPTLTAT